MSSTLFNSTAVGFPLPPLAGFWFGEGASTMVDNVDWLFAAITIVSTIVFIGLLILWIWFAWKYRMRPGHAAEPSASHNDRLEITWTIIPCIIFGIIFYFGFTGFIDMRNAPDDAYEIHVTAAKWSWSFRYPNGLTSPELHVPVDRPVLLIQESRDVLHSLYIPAFRIKMDVVPGRYTYQWFEANKVGRYDLFCAEYCGTNHANMYAPVFVESAEDFETFLATDPTEGMTDVEAGEYLYSAKYGCSSCHSVDGSAKAGGGPTFQNSFGTERTMQDGSKVVMDENYIRESILQPAAKIHFGYEPRMPSFQGQINDEELRKLIEFIKSKRNQDQ
jgi:cytochrome c oxidase subunit II